MAALMKEWGSGQQPDVVAAGIAVVTRRITRLAGLLRAGHVEVQVRRCLGMPQVACALRQCPSQSAVGFSSTTSCAEANRTLQRTLPQCTGH
jgi:hypothetical protein